MRTASRAAIACAAALWSFGSGIGLAQDESAKTRADFLRLIDRPRVPLAAQTSMRRDSELYAAEHFSIASEAGERITGILMSRINRSELPGSTIARRPAVVVLHGTGAKKEEQVALLRSLADRGFVAVAIDARYHGERAHSDDSITDYTNALKLKQMRDYGVAGSPTQYQEDHLVSLELGGHPTDPRNLWPEPYPRASDVDSIENDLNAKVCSGRLSLQAAQLQESELKHTDG